jgi:hypothetical protein
MNRWSRLVEGSTRVIDVLGARLALRRPGPVARLRTTEDLDEFIDRAFAASARNLAVASAFLPAHVRRVGAVAFLACRALDAFEDLSPDLSQARRDVLSAAEYLAGRSPSPPRASDLRPGGASDWVEAVLAERMPLVRAAIEDLSDGWQEGIVCLVGRISAAMAEAITTRERGEPLDRRRYGSTVLGEAVAYAVHLAGGEVPDELARAAGRILQLANDIRDARPPEAVIEQAFGVGLDAPLVPRLLRSLRFPARSGARAAVLYLALTTARFLLGHARIEPRGPARWPLALAVAAALSESSYRRTVELLDRWIQRAPPLVLRHYTDARVPRVHCDALPPYERPRVRAFAGFLARLHPAPDAAEALIAATWLSEQAGYFLRHVPEVPLTGALPARSLFLLAGDHLLSCAVKWVAPLGPSSIRAVGEAMVRAAALGQATGGRSDPSGELAHCLSRIVTGAQGLAETDASVLGSADAELAQALGALDRAVTRSGVRKAHLELGATLERVARLAEQAPMTLRGQILLHRRVVASIAARRD